MRHLHLIPRSQLQIHAAVLASTLSDPSCPTSPFLFSPLLFGPLFSHLTSSFSFFLLPENHGLTFFPSGISPLLFHQGKSSSFGCSDLLALGQGSLSSPLCQFSALSRGHLLSFQGSCSLLSFSLLSSHQCFSFTFSFCFFSRGCLALGFFSSLLGLLSLLFPGLRSSLFCCSLGSLSSRMSFPLAS